MNAFKGMTNSEDLRRCVSIMLEESVRHQKDKDH